MDAKRNGWWRFGRRRLGGYTLIEVVVSMAIFSIVAVTLGQVFGGFYASYQSTRALQRNLEVAQHAIQIMAKELRTSSIVSDGSSPTKKVAFFDHSQKKCFQYSFANNALYKQEAPQSVTDVAGCLGVAWGVETAGVRVSSGSVLGQLVYTKSDATVTPHVVGRLKVVMEVREKSGDENMSMLQTSVSLRDYGTAGLF